MVAFYIQISLVFLKTLSTPLIFSLIILSKAVNLVNTVGFLTEPCCWKKSSLTLCSILEGTLENEDLVETQIWNVKCCSVLSVTVGTRALNIKMCSWDCNLGRGRHCDCPAPLALLIPPPSGIMPANNRHLPGSLFVSQQPLCRAHVCLNAIFTGGCPVTLLPHAAPTQWPLMGSCLFHRSLFCFGHQPV